MVNKRLLTSLFLAAAIALAPASAVAAEEAEPAASQAAELSGWSYDAEEQSWRYVDPATGELRTGWFKDPETARWHYLSPATGAAQSGVVKSAGKWYLFSQGSAEQPPYEHVGWTKYAGSWYYIRPNGTVFTGWLPWGSDWYYFSPDTGKMVTGWTYGGTKSSIYYFNANGKMRRGWLESAGNRYYFQPNGRMANYWTVIDGVYQAFEPDGRWASALVGLPAEDAARMANLSARQRAFIAACDATPWPGANLCAGWVSNVFARAGLGGVAGNACDIAYAWATSTNLADLKPGMIIAVPTHPRTDAGRIWGHVGIYVGNGLVRDSARTGLRTVDLGSWIGWYGATYPVKWGWANGVALG